MMTRLDRETRREVSTSDILAAIDEGRQGRRVRELHHNLSAYDAQYVALAEVFGLPLLTSDARIQRSGAAKCAIELFA